MGAATAQEAAARTETRVFMYMLKTIGIVLWWEMSKCVGGDVFELQKDGVRLYILFRL